MSKINLNYIRKKKSFVKKNKFSTKAHGFLLQKSNLSEIRLIKKMKVLV